MARHRGLWARSAAWRWTFILSGLATATVVLVGPWNPAPTGPLSLATYRPPPQQAMIAFPQRLSSGRTGAGSRVIGTGPSDATFDIGVAPPPPSFAPGTELHAIGVYEGALRPDEKKRPWWANCLPFRDDPDAMTRCHQKYAAEQSQTPVTITVNVSRTGPPLVLALMAYDPVIWKIVPTPGVNIQKIILGGYHGQDIKGVPDDLAVDVFTYESSPCKKCSRHAGYFHAYKEESREYSKAVAKLRSITGLSLRSFQGAYKSDRFSVSFSTAPMATRVEAEGEEERLDLYTGEHFSNHVKLAGLSVPLPEGRWRGIAFARNPLNGGRDEMIVLARIEKDVLAGLIGVRAQVVDDGRGFPLQPSCRRNDIHACKVDKNEPFGAQLCYWVNHASHPWSKPIFSHAATYLDGLSIVPPETMLNAAFHKADRRSSLTVYYYTNPETAGIHTPKSGWATSPWHPKQIRSFPVKQRFLSDYVQWAESWYPIFKATRSQ